MSFSPSYVDGLMGQFREKDHGHYFEYKAAPDPIFGHEFPYLIYVSDDGSVRYGDVKKTVAYIVVDEDENGPVVEKWFIKNQREYR